MNTVSAPKSRGETNVTFNGECSLIKKLKCLFNAIFPENLAFILTQRILTVHLWGHFLSYNGKLTKGRAPSYVCLCKYMPQRRRRINAHMTNKWPIPLKPKSPLPALSAIYHSVALEIVVRTHTSHVYPHTVNYIGPEYSMTLRKTMLNTSSHWWSCHFRKWLTGLQIL